MTLSEVSSLCPAPEGMEWHGSGNLAEFEFVARRTSSAWVNLRGDATQDDDARGWYVTVTACYLNMSVTTGGFLPDLPAAYFRALQAVGLAPDAEKEDLRRRLTWTSEVPTTPGRYLVEDPDADGAILMYEFGVGGLGWVEYVPHTVRFGPLGFASDSRFLLLANLKET